LAVLNSSAWVQVTESKIENPGVGSTWQYPVSSSAIDGDTVIISAPSFSGNPEKNWRVYRADGLGNWWLEDELEAPFSAAVALSGDRAIVGAHGQVYVFERTDGKWTRVALIPKPDPDNPGYFGYRVALSGNTAVVGARNDGEVATESGAAYVFVNTEGVWTLQAKLTASDAAAFDLFGNSVAISGDTMVVGANGQFSINYPNSAYVFERSNGAWTEQARLTASDAGTSVSFRGPVSISGDTVVASGSSGDVFVFTRSGSEWTEQDRLWASDLVQGDQFGASLAISGDTVVVGAPGTDDGGYNKGSAYVFTRTDGTWTQQVEIHGTDTESNQFGLSVGVSGDHMAVGATGDDDGGIWNGPAYIFARSDGTWTQQPKLAPSDPAGEDGFGCSVAISGTAAAIGAHLDDLAWTDAGAVFVFERSGEGWSQQARLAASDAGVYDEFGYSVAMSENTIVVGAPRDVIGSNRSGSAYVFSGADGKWTQEDKLIPSDGRTSDWFGFSVAVSGDTALVGASYGDSGGTDSGTVYVFSRSGGAWLQQAELTPSDAADGDYFGYSVAISGDTAVAGAYGDDDGGAVSGSAYVFTRSGSVWTQQAKLTASDAVEYNHFGCSVAISGDTIVVGAGIGHYGDPGVAYVFTRSGAVWTQQAKLVTDDPSAFESGYRIGISVGISGDMVVLGVGQGSDGEIRGGAASVFKRSGTDWSQQIKLTASDTATNDIFGLCVAIDENTVLVGAPRNDGPERDSGAAYVFTLGIFPEVNTWLLH